MEDKPLFEAVKAGDLSAVENRLRSGADVNAADEHGWGPLNYAAGRGDFAVVKLLVESGADSLKVDGNNRRPYLIALAAGRTEVAKYLREVEDRADPETAKSLRPDREYCKAYHLEELRQFPAWSEPKTNSTTDKGLREADQQEKGFDDDSIVFIHQDFTVTASMRRGENVIFDRVSPEWQQFCSGRLGFTVPDDLDLIATAAEATA
jgi:hypothetical protein